MFWTQIYDLTLGIGVIILQVSAIGLIVLHINKNSRGKFYQFIEDRKFLLAFLLAFVAVLGSLFYSEVIGLEPCFFCWWQRICIYPLALILGISLWSKDHEVIKKYAIILAIIGGIFGIYHYLVEKFSFIAATVDCSATGAVSCSISPVNVFGGYVTIPMMSLTILVVIILLLTLKKRS